MRIIRWVVAVAALAVIGGFLAGFVGALIRPQPGLTPTRLIDRQPEA